MDSNTCHLVSEATNGASTSALTRDCYISEIVHQLRDPSQAHGGVRAGGAVRMPISHLETRDVTTL